MSDTSSGGGSQDFCGHEARIERLPFDVYERYSIAAQVVRSVGDPRGRVLDVGGYSPPFWPQFRSLAATFLPDFNPVVADVQHGPELCNYVNASGMDLPFRDRTFGFVLAQDSLEHIPSQERFRFLGELVRVSAEYVLLCFPFRTPLNEACERIIFRYIEKRKGVRLPALREHAEFGLPFLADIEGWLQDAGFSYRMWTHGNSLVWLHMMLAKNHLWSQGVPELGEDLDAIFNLRFAPGDYREPCYRAFLLVSSTETAARALDRVSGFRGEMLSSADQQTVHSICQLAMASVSSLEVEQRSQHIINLADRSERWHEATAEEARQTSRDHHNRLAESESRLQRFETLLQQRQVALDAAAALAEHRQNLLLQQQAQREAVENDLRNIEAAHKQAQAAHRATLEELETLRHKISRFPLRFLLR